MTVGSLGSAVFYVTDKSVKTINSMSWKKKYNYSVHKMHGRKGILEYTGMDPDEIDLEVKVSAFLGVRPLDVMNELNNMAASSAVIPFVLGTDVIGTSWVITELHASPDFFYLDGTLISAPFKIKIKEYGEE